MYSLSIDFSRLKFRHYLTRLRPKRIILSHDLGVLNDSPQLVHDRLVDVCLLSRMNNSKFINIKQNELALPLAYPSLFVDVNVTCLWPRRRQKMVINLRKQQNISHVQLCLLCSCGNFARFGYFSTYQQMNCLWRSPK